MKRAIKTPALHDAYPIRTVSAMTGLSADVIRAWEKRHAVVVPIRGPRGARLYSAADIARLRLLARAVSSGRAIGDVAGLNGSQLQQLTGQTAAEPPERHDGFIADVIENLRRFEHGAVKQLLGHALTGLGVRAFVYEVAVPLLEEVGNRWSRGDLSVAEEHLLSGIVRNLVAGLIQTRVRSGRPVAALATPAGERHEHGLLLIALLALDAGLDVAYLGTDLPAAEILDAACRSNAVLLGISLVCADNSPQAVREVKAIQRALPAHIEFWLGGREAAGAAARVGAFRGRVLDQLPAAELELARIAGMPRYGP